jgi:hypothetical protein
MASAFPCRADVRVCYESAEHAKIARDTLAVDEEIQPTKIQRSYSIQGGALTIHFAAVEVRLLRVALSSIFDMLQVISNTLAEFS